MNILLIKTSALGDIVHTFPVLSYLRELMPEAIIDWVVEEPFSELIEAHPCVDHVLKISSKKWRQSPIQNRGEIQNFRRLLRRKKYDVVFDLQGNIKSGAILSQVRAKNKVGFGWKSVSEWPNALFTNRKINPPSGKNIREDYVGLVQAYFGDIKPFEAKPVVLSNKPIDLDVSHATLVFPAAFWKNKQLEQKQLIDFLKQLDKGPYFFCWGTDDERLRAIALSKYFDKSVVLEKYPLPVLQSVMAQAKLVVAMDSLPLHLCATTSTPTISFFGPSSAKKYGPIGSQHKAFQGQCPYNITFEKRCPKLRTCKTGACLDEF